MQIIVPPPPNYVQTLDGILWGSKNYLLGGWDMRGGSTIAIPHGLPDIRKLCGGLVSIINDAGSSADFCTVSYRTMGPYSNLRFELDRNDIILTSVATGAYDNISYSGTTQDRGRCILFVTS